MAADYPEPLTIPPRSPPHKQTFIILHGRGSSGEKFGPTLLDEPISSSSPSVDTSPSTLSSAFPHARFIFPSAARRRATIYRRAYTHQWFDNWKLDPPATEREELQEPGLRETTAFVHALLRREIEEVPGGARNVILGGLSQGQAAVLTALLLWEGEPLGAAFGMCGWLPYTVRLREQLEGTSTLHDLANSGEESFDPFQRDDPDDGSEHRDAALAPWARAVAWLRDEIQVPRSKDATSELSFRATPLFLGHGGKDDRVGITLGREASSCLVSLGMRVDWHEYATLGHWYSAAMLQDIVAFIQNQSK
ncbi:acyl-protein thioesterase [Seiridium cupressi]